MSNQAISARNKDSALRISVVRGKELVPLLPSNANISAEQPTKGVLLERHFVGAGEIPEHEHPDLCLHLQVTGVADFEWWSAGRNTVEHSRPGSLILIPAGTRDRLRWVGASERLILSIDQEGLNNFAEDLGVARSTDLRGDWAFTDASLQRLMMEMWEQARQHWPLGGLYADLLTVGLKKSLLRRHSVDAAEPPILKGGLSLPQLRRAMEFINENLVHDLRLESITKELNLSPSHFAHVFRNSTGTTPYQYLLDQRMFRARHLLRTTRLPVRVVSEALGFSSPTNFVRTFRQRVGLTAAFWRKN